MSTCILGIEPGGVGHARKNRHHRSFGAFCRWRRLLSPLASIHRRRGSARTLRPTGKRDTRIHSIRLHSTRTVNGLCHRTHRALCRNRNRRRRGREHARSRRSPFPPPPHTNSSRDLPTSGKVEAAAPLQQRPEKPELETPRWRGESMLPAPSNRTLRALFRPSYLGSTPPSPKQDGVFACEPCSLLVV